MMEQCAVPGCDTLTDRGICDACDAWVDDQVRQLETDAGKRMAAATPVPPPSPPIYASESTKDRAGADAKVARQ